MYDVVNSVVLTYEQTTGSRKLGYRTFRHFYSSGYD